MEKVIIMTYSELLEKSQSWDKTCDALGLNPYIINEGIIDGNEKITINQDLAKNLLNL